MSDPYEVGPDVAAQNIPTPFADGLTPAPIDPEWHARQEARYAAENREREARERRTLAVHAALQLAGSHPNPSDADAVLESAGKFLAFLNGGDGRSVN
jgi:hypothetical protein